MRRYELTVIGVGPHIEGFIGGAIARRARWRNLHCLEFNLFGFFVRKDEFAFILFVPDVFDVLFVVFQFGDEIAESASRDAQLQAYKDLKVVGRAFVQHAVMDVLHVEFRVFAGQLYFIFHGFHLALFACADDCPPSDNSM